MFFLLLSPQWGYGKHVCRGMQYAQALLNRAFIELFRRCTVALAEPDGTPGADPDRFAQDFAKSIGTPFAKYPIRVLFKYRDGAAHAGDSKVSA